MKTSLPNFSQLTRGYSIALVAAAVLSTTAIFIRYLSQTYHVPALVLAFWRDLFAPLTLLPVFLCFRPDLLKIKRPDLLYLGGYGFVLAVFNALWTLSVALNGAAVSTVLVYCSTGFTALLGWWFLRERLDWAKILAVILCLGGCVLVSGAFNLAAWQVNLLGILTGTLSGVCYAVYSLLGRAAAQRGVNPWTSLFYTFTFAAFFLLCFNLLPGGFLPGAAPHPIDLFWLGGAAAGWGLLFLLAAGPTVIGFGLYNVSLGLLPSSVANLLVTLEPVFTTLLAYFLFGERLNMAQFGGGALILGGVIFLRIYEGWRSNQMENSRQPHEVVQTAV
jgi:drug/metabolite transporter (DMT)-like permease